MRNAKRIYIFINSICWTLILQIFTFIHPQCSICGESYFCHWCAGYPADIHRIVNGGHGGHVVFRCGIVLSQLVRVAPDAVLRLVSGLSCRAASQKPVAVIGGLPPNYRKQFRVGCTTAGSALRARPDEVADELMLRCGFRVTSLPGLASAPRIGRPVHRGRAGGHLHPRNVGDGGRTGALCF